MNSRDRSYSLSFPRESTLPAIDERLAEAGGDYEILRGEKIRVSPSNPEHADPHFAIDAVVYAHLSPGWRGATDLLTRTDVESDFATDTCVRREGTDPRTGKRYLEELAFEIVNEQRPGDVTAKAEELTERGVRRVFAIFVKKREVREWKSGAWALLEPDGVVDDVCFHPAVPVRALLDAAEIKAAVVHALDAQGHPAIESIRRQAAVLARAEGVLAVLAVLAARGVALADADRDRVRACRDEATLTRWLARAATATAAGQVFAA